MSQKPETDRMVRSTDSDKIEGVNNAVGQIEAGSITVDPVDQINFTAKALIEMIEALGSSPSLLRAATHVRLAADYVHQSLNHK